MPATCEILYNLGPSQSPVRIVTSLWRGAVLILIVVGRGGGSRAWCIPNRWSTLPWKNATWPTDFQGPPKARNCTRSKIYCKSCLPKISMRWQPLGDPFSCWIFGLWLGWAVGRLGAVTIFFFPKTDSKEKWSSSVPWFHHDGVSMLIKDACFLTFSNNLLSFIFFGGKFKVQTEVSTQGPGCLRSVLESFQSSWRSCTHFIQFFSFCWNDGPNV